VGLDDAAMKKNAASVRREILGIFID